MPLLSVFSIPVCAVPYSDTGRLISDTENRDVSSFSGIPMPRAFSPCWEKEKNTRHIFQNMSDLF